MTDKFGWGRAKAMAETRGASMEAKSDERISALQGEAQKRESKLYTQTLLTHKTMTHERKIHGW